MIIFSDFGQTEKKLLLLLLSLLFYWWLVCGSTTAYASGIPEPMYQITESELTTLENNISRLKAINSKLQSESKKQLEQVAQLRTQVSQLKQQLMQLREASMTQEDSLTNANKLLETFAIEEKNKRLKIKAQRNTYFVMMVAAAVAAVCHR